MLSNHIKQPIKKFLETRLFKTGAMSLMATVLTRAINLVSVPIFSRLLSTDEYGQVDVFMTYVNVFFVILGLDFHGAVGKGRIDFEDKADEFVTSSILFSTISATVIVLVINIFFSKIYVVFGLERWAVNLMLLYSYAMFLMSYRSAELNFYYEYKENMMMSVSVATLNLMLSILFISTVFRDNHLLGRILGATIPTVICAIAIYYYYGKRGNWSFKRSYISYSLQFGVPLIPHNLSHMVLASADKVMINSIISSSASGIYSLSYTLGMLIQVASEALNQVFGPWQLRKLQAGEKKTVRIMQKPYLMLYCMITIAVLAVSPEIVKIIGSKEYWDGVSIITWIVYATFLNFTYTLYVNVEFFYKKTALISSGTVLAAVCNIVLNMLFLEAYGYRFAAISTVISYMLLLIFHMVILNCVLKDPIVDNTYVILIVIAIFVVTVIMSVFLESILVRIVVAVVAEMLAGSALLVLYKKSKIVQE